SPWTLDMDRDRFDREGWEYSFSFTSTFHNHNKSFDTVRRRRWIRQYRSTSIQSHLCLYSPPAEIAVGTSYNPFSSPSLSSPSSSSPSSSSSTNERISISISPRLSLSEMNFSPSSHCVDEQRWERTR